MRAEGERPNGFSFEFKRIALAEDACCPGTWGAARVLAGNATNWPRLAAPAAAPALKKSRRSISELL
jgi:hypothetical protein